jgi:hypothetical protein
VNVQVTTLGLARLLLPGEHRSWRDCARLARAPGVVFPRLLELVTLEASIRE